MEELLKTLINKIDNKFELLSKDILELKEGNARIEERMEKFEERMDKLEERQENTDLSIKHFASEFRSHFGKVETEIKQLQDSLKLYVTDLHHVKTDVEFLSGKTGIHDTKINNIEKRLEV